MSIPDPLPALRSVDVTPVQEGGEESLRFVVHDRIHIAPQTLAVSPAGYFVLAIIVLIVSLIGLRIGVTLFDREAILTRWR